MEKKNVNKILEWLHQNHKKVKKQTIDRRNRMEVTRHSIQHQGGVVGICRQGFEGDPEDGLQQSSSEFEKALKAGD